MANLPQAISNEKNTFPKQTAISDIEATFGTNRRVFLANTGSPSGSPAPAATRDFKEGTSAFLEKRKPNFKNE